MQQPLKARVRNGRLVLDEPTDLPEGIEVPLVLADGDEMDAEEQKALFESLRAGVADMKAGRTVDAREAIARLRART
jgi:hypothetical protein